MRRATLRISIRLPLLLLAPCSRVAALPQDGSFCGVVRVMKFDNNTIRLMGRVIDRIDLVRKNPHRYEIDAETLSAISRHLEQLEGLLPRITTIKAG